MKLFEHAEFEQAILQPAEHFRGRGLRPAIIEKNYCPVPRKYTSCCDPDVASVVIVIVPGS
jgi:hypothetical protein